MKAALLIVTVATAALASGSRPFLPRQTGLLDAEDLSDDCVENAIDLLNSLPTPKPELLQALNKPTDEGCYSIPESLDGDYSSYSSAVESWYSDNGSLASSVESNCPQATPTITPEFCEGMGPDDRSDAVGKTGMSIAALAWAVMGAVIAL